jgi:DNA invertase Pin-like site-specific DNA recombinase
VDLVVLDQGIDTSTAVCRMFFQIVGAIAEFEHALMSERTRDGLAAARAEALWVGCGVKVWGSLELVGRTFAGR